jgi:dTDP-4-amino-4,6-dideoxygalactose transaminase
MQVPLLDLQRQYAPLREEILAAIARLCDSQQFILGKEAAEFEREMAAFLGVGHAIGCASGTDALWLALVAAGGQPGDSVLTTPFTFFATASAIVRAQARPVFADIDPRTLNLDPREAGRCAASVPDLRALLPVHLYGQCADMDAFRELAAELKVPVIEDAAQAFGATWRGQHAGALGAAATFSFYPTKNLSAMGDAGCVTSSDHDMAERMRRLRNHGSVNRYYHEEIGWNCRLDGIQAAVLRVKLKHVGEWNTARRERAATYNRLFNAAGLSASGGPLRLLETPPEAFHVYHQYVIRTQRRDELRAFLNDRGIGTEIYYPLPLHLQKCFSYLGYREGDLPESEQAAREVLALPMEQMSNFYS